MLILARNTLLVNLRFLDRALSRFQYVRMRKSSIATDGHYLFFNPENILNKYKSEKEIINRDYLHTVFHCVFQHMYGLASVNRPVWDLATDIAVENMINELELQALTCARQNIQQADIEKIKKNVKYMTAECIYDYLMGSNLTEKQIAIMRGSFYADNHEFWYLTMEQLVTQFNVLMQGNAGNNTPGIGVQVTFTKISDGNGPGEETDTDGSGTGDENDDSSRPVGISQADSDDWKDISEHIKIDIETFSKQHGTKAGSMVQNLNEVTREKYDYTEFLKKFAVMGEVMKLNPDEFDYIYYTYGMTLNENVPLIEPLEYRDVKRVKEFVIAIDTSGSTSGELVQKFLNKTYNILKSEENFFTKMNIHIIQCDADIQEHVKITTQEEFDEYIKTMQIHGMGGTDFRPVFNYVDELITNKEFLNLKGLIYFTDGYGSFPSKMPPYETAFIFIDDGFNNPDIPPWAIKLVLRANEI